MSRIFRSTVQLKPSYCHDANVLRRCQSFLYSATQHQILPNTPNLMVWKYPIFFLYSLLQFHRINFQNNKNKFFFWTRIHLHWFLSPENNDKIYPPPIAAILETTRLQQVHCEMHIQWRFSAKQKLSICHLITIRIHYTSTELENCILINLRWRPVKITDNEWILQKWLFYCGTQFSVYVVYRKQYAISQNGNQSSGLCSCAYAFYVVPVQNGACAALSFQMDVICCPGLLLFLSRSRRNCALATRVDSFFQFNCIFSVLSYFFWEIRVNQNRTTDHKSRSERDEVNAIKKNN